MELLSLLAGLGVRLRLLHVLLQVVETESTVTFAADTEDGQGLRLLGLEDHVLGVPSVTDSEIQNLIRCCEPVDVLFQLERLLLFVEFVFLDLQLEHVNVVHSLALLLPHVFLRLELLALLIDLGPLKLPLLLSLLFRRLLDLQEITLLLLQFAVFEFPESFLILQPLLFVCLPGLLLRVELVPLLLNLLLFSLGGQLLLPLPRSFLLHEVLPRLPDEVEVSVLHLVSFLLPCLLFADQLFFLLHDSVVLELLLSHLFLLPELLLLQDLLSLALELLLLQDDGPLSFELPCLLLFEERVPFVDDLVLLYLDFVEFALLESFLLLQLKIKMLQPLVFESQVLFVLVKLLLLVVELGALLRNLTLFILELLALLLLFELHLLSLSSKLLLLALILLILELLHPFLLLMPDLALPKQLLPLLLDLLQLNFLKSLFF